MNIRPKGFILILILSVPYLLTHLCISQRISSYLYGQNAWMPSLVTGGEMENVFQQLKQDSTEPFSIIRIGGTRFDDNALSYEQYEDLIAEIRAIGAEPLVQVPISESVQYSADLVNHLNVTKSLNIKFWSIGNEPDLGWLDEQVDGRTINSADDVAFYFKARASVMKAVDSSIKIFGPDYSFFVDAQDDSGWNPMATWQYPLIDNNDYGLWGKDGNGNYYIDYYAFHVYQFVDPDNVERKINTILPHLSTINSSYRDADNQLGWAITETHITTDNDKMPSTEKTWSFYAGQHIAEIMGLGMKYKAFTVAPWSIHESSGLRDGAGSFEGGRYDLGFFDAAPDYKPRSTYHHEFLLSKKAKTDFLWGYTNNGNLKQVATKDDTGYAIMIMNNNSFAGSYTLRFNYEDQTNTFEIYVDAGESKEYQSSIEAYETQMVFFDIDEVYQGKIIYNSQHAAAGNAPSYFGHTPDRVSYNVWDNNSWRDVFPPDQLDNAKINSTYSLADNGSFEVNNLIIESNASLTIESGEHLTVYGDMINHGAVMVKSGGSLITKGDVSGAGFTVERNTTFDSSTGRYSAVGAPVSGATTSVLGSKVYAYDETVNYGSEGSGRFFEVTTPSTMSPGDAFFSAFTGIVSFLGTPNTGQIDVHLIYNEEQDGVNAGFNLIANPYPAAVNFEDFVELNTINNAVISGAIYLWDDVGSNAGQRNNGDYIIVNSMGAVSAGSGRASDWNGYIGSGQGFFVKAIQTGTLSFTDNMKVEGSNEDANFYRANGAQSVFSQPTMKLALTDQKQTASMQVLIGLAEDATLGVDIKYDAVQLGGSNGIKLYSLIKNNIPYAIQGISPDAKAVKLGMELSKNGEYSLSIVSKQNWGVYHEVALIDQENGELIVLNEGSKYSFTSASGTFHDRFELRLTGNQGLLSPPMAKEFTTRYTDHGIQITNHQIDHPLEVQILDISGRSLMKNKYFGDEDISIPFRFELGKVYIINMIINEKSKSDKVVIQ